MGRKLTITLEVKSGIVHDFSATVDGRLALSGDGTVPRRATLDVPEGPVRLRVLAVGVPGSKYLVKVAVGDEEETAWRYTLDTTVQGVDCDV